MDEFCEDDEPIEDVQSAWRKGERGVTKGKRRLSPKSQAIVDRAAMEWDDLNRDFKSE
jgi:hypothetical protein